MGIVYNTKVGLGYINRSPCHQKVIHRQVIKGLTPQNVQYLKSLGLSVIADVKRRRKTVKKIN